MATAGPGEIVVTGTVRDLVTGSGVAFVDRGVTTLKGIEGEWRLHAVATEPDDQLGLPEPAPAAQPARSSRISVVFGLVGIGALGLAAAALLLPRILAGPVVPGPNSVGHVANGGREFDLAVGVGQQPSGLAAGERAIWVVNFADQTLSRIDPATGRVSANPAIPGSPSAVTYGAGSVWVTTHFGLAAGDVGSVVRFDSRPVKGPTIPVGNGVEAIAYGEGWIWVADRIADVVRKIDPGTDRLMPEAVPVGRAPGAIAVGAGSVWVTSTLDDTLWRIDPATSSVDETIALRGPASAIAVTSAAVWVTSETDDWVARIDPATNLRVSSVDGLDGPRGIAVTDDAVWVAVGREGRLVRIDPTTNEVAQGYDVAGLPDAVVVDDTGGVWVSVRAP
jgi:streptogramin lyase